MSSTGFTSNFERPSIASSTGRITTRKYKPYKRPRAANKRNTTGFEGVFYDPSRRKYRVQLMFNGVRVSGAGYETAQEAAAARDELFERLGREAKS